MNIGDLLSIEIDKCQQKVGVLLNIRCFKRPKYTMSYITYSIKVLHPDGECVWYDLWNGEKLPKVLRKI